MPEYDKELEGTNVGQVLPKGEIVGFVDPSLPAYRIPVKQGEKIKPPIAGVKSEQSNLGCTAKSAVVSE